MTHEKLYSNIVLTALDFHTVELRLHYFECSDCLFRVLLLTLKGRFHAVSWHKERTSTFVDALFLIGACVIYTSIYQLFRNFYGWLGR